MLILALDTSTVPASVALGRDGKPIAVRTLEATAARSETVLPAIDEALTEVGETAASIGAVVVGAGPGSFTGVRIGASLAKGFCFALDVPLYAYSSLAAAAVDSREEGRVCVLLEARRDQVYAAAYEVGKGSLTERMAPCADSVSAVADAMPAGPGGWVFVGSGSHVHRSLLEQRGGSVESGGPSSPSAPALLTLFAWDGEGGPVQDVRGWEPRYVRPPQAEREAR